MLVELLADPIDHLHQLLEHGHRDKAMHRKIDDMVNEILSVGTAMLGARADEFRNHIQLRRAAVGIDVVLGEKSNEQIRLRDNQRKQPEIAKETLHADQFDARPTNEMVEHVRGLLALHLKMLSVVVFEAIGEKGQQRSTRLTTEGEKQFVTAGILAERT